jgi:NAD(P)-dependent dehydrogenase (short-subunit alcohol dehydrogenase family)
MKLKGKTAIITGARRGIGKGIALKFAQEGASVVVSDISVEDCEQVVKEIEKLGGRAVAARCDVSSKQDVQAMLQRATDAFGKVDILVNNAGIYLQKQVNQLSEEEWDRVLAINLKSVFLCSQAVLPGMIERKYGKIINIASIAGMVGFAESSAYCASKGGIINLTREMALELAAHKINVNAIGPGVIETPMTKGMLENEQAKQGLLAGIPLKRIGTPEDIANAALYLASDESDYVTGHCLFVDGGWLVQ